MDARANARVHRQQLCWHLELLAVIVLPKIVPIKIADVAAAIIAILEIGTLNCSSSACRSDLVTKATAEPISSVAPLTGSASLNFIPASLRLHDADSTITGRSQFSQHMRALLAYPSGAVISAIYLQPIPAYLRDLQGVDFPSARPIVPGPPPNAASAAAHALSPE